MRYTKISDNLNKIEKDDGTSIYQITIHTIEEGRANCLPHYGYSWMTLKPEEIAKISREYFSSLKSAISNTEESRKK